MTSDADSAQRGVAAIILAAGRSTRMKTTLPKVMHEVCGRPMLSHVLDACRAAGIDSLYVVVGFGREAITAAFGNEPGVHFVEQVEQKGTGHAVSMCEPSLKGFVGDVVVIAGDMPLIRAETLRTLLASHRASGAAASIATTELADPTGYGRIVRNASGEFDRIVEHRDCDAGQLKISEVNPSYYCYDAATLFEALKKVRPNNAKSELYLTDTLAILKSDGKAVRASTKVPAADATGINSRVDLAEVNRLMQRRIQAQWMEGGVTIVDPENTWIDSRAQIGADAVIKPFSYIEGHARIGAGASIGPFAYVGDGAVVEDGGHAGPGALTALDALRTQVGRTGSDARQKAQAVRRPPAQTGCA
jgi:bifunctional UDP-N-acetylglucosamine pyrophosphorylase/glucosamine-1-phosphate N-acetyltransferase